MPFPKDELRLIDVDGQSIGHRPRREIGELVKAGYAEYLYYNGRRQGIRGAALTVPIGIKGSAAERALSLSNILGTKFAYRSKVSTPNVNFFDFKHKRMNRDESSAAALIRMLPQTPCRKGADTDSANQRKR